MPTVDRRADSADEQFIYVFKHMAERINAWAEEKGWNADAPARSPQLAALPSEQFLSICLNHKITKLALVDTEIAEAIEGLRHGDPASDKIPEFRASEEELADAIIRIMHYAAFHKLRVAEALVAKFQMNHTRPYRHGKLA